MSKRLNQRAEALEKIAAHILTEGLAQTSLRQLAAAAGISDRMLLYYFKDKSDILASALEAIALSMQRHLNEALPEDRRLPPSEFLARAAEVTGAGALQSYMPLGLEIAAAAARGQEPHTMVMARISESFLQWIEARLAIEESGRRRDMAALILVLIDGFAFFGTSDRFDLAAKATSAMQELMNERQP